MDNKDSVDLCQLDILDKDAIYISSLVKEFKNVKKLNLMKNKISDIGGVKIIEMMLDNNISELNLQCNLITEKTLNQLLVLVRQRQK